MGFKLTPDLHLQHGQLVALPQDLGDLSNRGIDLGLADGGDVDRADPRPGRRRALCGLLSLLGSLPGGLHLHGGGGAGGRSAVCRLVPDSMKGHLYWSTAVQILRSLCEKHLGKIDPKWEGILRGARAEEARKRPGESPHH